MKTTVALNWKSFPMGVLFLSNPAAEASDAVSDAVSCAGWCKAELSSKLPPHSSASSVQPEFRGPKSLVSSVSFVALSFLQPTGEITINQWLI